MSPAGRPKSENPKNVRLEIRLTKQQADDLEYCAEKLGTNRTEVINIGVQKIKNELDKK